MARIIISLYFENGDIYIGEFSKDVPNGKGTLFYSDHTQISGVWKDGELISNF